MHMLLLGDPGVGKSQILKMAAKLAIRSVHTTGIGQCVARAELLAKHARETFASAKWRLSPPLLLLTMAALCRHHVCRSNCCSHARWWW